MSKIRKRREPQTILLASTKCSVKSRNRKRRATATTRIIAYLRAIRARGLSYYRLEPERLAKRLGLHRETVLRIVNRLCAQGSYFHFEKRQDGKRGQARWVVVFLERGFNNISAPPYISPYKFSERKRYQNTNGGTSPRALDEFHQPLKPSKVLLRLGAKLADECLSLHHEGFRVRRSYPHALGFCRRALSEGFSKRDVAQAWLSGLHYTHAIASDCGTRFECSLVAKRALQLLRADGLQPLERFEKLLEQWKRDGGRGRIEARKWKEEKTPAEPVKTMHVWHNPLAMPSQPATLKPMPKPYRECSEKEWAEKAAKLREQAAKLQALIGEK